MISFGLKKAQLAVFLTLISTCVAAQADTNAPACSSPEVVLQRYIDAVGGKGALDTQSRSMTAKETNAGFGTEHYIYKFKWKTPNKVTAGSVPYLMGVFPIYYPNGTFKFDGNSWSNFLGRTSHNDDALPQRQRELTAKYPYNEGPYFLELRVAADPLIVTRANELYTGFEADPGSGGDSGLCVVRANQFRLLRNQRQDTLYFDAASGLLKAWEVHTGFPPNNDPVKFQFDDYRQVGAIKFPFYLHFTFNDTTFRYTNVDLIQPLADAEFQAKP
ncbi:MAG: hypothetical protein ABSF53_13785 [Terracidiphilus sp.]|jgi:hypothetical protein